MRPPSSGGIGMRLKAISIRLTEMPAAHTLITNRSEIPSITTSLSTTAQPIACKRLEAGPASAVSIMSRLKCLK